jgi:hypothetical protein
MGIEFINRILKSTAIFGALAAVAVTYYFGWQLGVGFLTGVCWSLANFLFLRGLIIQVITPEQTKKNLTIIFSVLKFPVLYVAGYFLATSGWFSLYVLLAGFSFIFLVIILKVLSRMMMGLEAISFKHNETGSSN